VPSHKDEPTRGVAVAGDFRPRSQSLPVPQSALPRCLAASRHVDIAPALVNNEGSSDSVLSGLNHAASVLAVYASQPASRRTTQDSLAAGGRPLLRGIGYPPGYFRGFNSCFLLGQACPGAMTIKPNPQIQLANAATWLGQHTCRPSDAAFLFNAELMRPESH
jgi:hypothetical protein